MNRLPPGGRLDHRQFKFHLAVALLLHFRDLNYRACLSAGRLDDLPGRRDLVRLKASNPLLDPDKPPEKRFRWRREAMTESQEIHRGLVRPALFENFADQRLSRVRLKGRDINWAELARRVESQPIAQSPGRALPQRGRLVFWHATWRTNGQLHHCRTARTSFGHVVAVVLRFALVARN